MHVETIRFFSELVAGRCVLSVEYLLRKSKFFAIEYDSLLGAIGNPDLPRFYRRYLIDIIHNVFVDCEPYRKIHSHDTFHCLVAPSADPEAPAPVPRRKVDFDGRSNKTNTEVGTNRIDPFHHYPERRAPTGHAALKKVLARIACAPAAASTAMRHATWSCCDCCVCAVS